MEPQELFGFLWHSFPDSKRAVAEQESLQLPHWSETPTPGTKSDGVILLTQEGDRWRFGRSGYLLLSEQPLPPTVPSGWMCMGVDVPDGWTGVDERSRVEVVTRGGTEDQTPVSGVRHYVRVRSRQA